jgi:hypothetical protein
MATNKNQHFVPRCYLKAFTKEEGNATIKIFNLDRQRFIPTAPVKNQCSGSYFYGEDPKLEEVIQSCEGQYANLLRKIRKPGYFLEDEDKSFLRFFWLFQHLRTEAASRRAVEMAAEAEVVVGSKLSPVEYGIKEAVQMAMGMVSEVASVIDDLKLCLVRNRTDVPFVTSDDPAVASNRWYLEDCRARGCSFGLSAAGLITLLPLTPDILCLAYDGDVYSVQHDRGWVEVRNVGDVKALNQHQMLSCFANLYVPETAAEDDLMTQYADCAKYRLTVRHKVNYAVLDSSDNGYDRFVVTEPNDSTRNSDALLHSQSLHPKPTRWPALLRWRIPGVIYENGTGVNYVRNAGAVSSDSMNPFRKLRAR